MNRKYTLALAVATVAILAFAAPPGDVSKQPQIFFLKSHGKTIAELRVEPEASCSMAGSGPWPRGGGDGDGGGRGFVVQGSYTVTNASLDIVSGTNRITVIADEIEVRHEAK